MKSDRSRFLSGPDDFTDILLPKPKEPVETFDVDCDEMERLLIDVVLGRPSAVTTEAAARLRDQLVRQVRAIKEAGRMVDIPGEFPDA